MPEEVWTLTVPLVRIKTHFFQVLEPEYLIMLFLGGIHEIKKPAVLHHVIEKEHKKTVGLSGARKPGCNPLVHSQISFSA